MTCGHNQAYQHTHNETHRKGGGREKGTERIFEEIMTKRLPKFDFKNLCIKETH